MGSGNIVCDFCWRRPCVWHCISQAIGNVSLQTHRTFGKYSVLYFRQGCLQTAAFFLILYILMLMYNFVQVKLANPIALLHGNNVGEREPQVKWISTAIGVICILAGYYLAVTVHGVLEAVNMFFIAVILVIVGTYELFMSVSIALLKMLKKNKKYYYQTAHFITVSGMLYRMKRNAVGLDKHLCAFYNGACDDINNGLSLCRRGGFLAEQFKKELTATLHFENIPGCCCQSNP